ncbi:MAG: ribosomal protein S18-alanine N-acetyltransferase [Erysipelotrichaceae bacterium]|nr:ribosomal protein S18-alanine N-acetyltransferase [Erysipelotrichaceae bacterium]
MIRPMLVTDINEVVRIEEIVFNDNWKTEAFTYELCDNPFSHYWVIKDANRIIGYAGMWVTFETAQITNIAILPDYQHRGYGQQLMDQILATAQANHCEVLTLEVRVSNLKAIAFYQKNGFIYINTKKGYYKNNYEDAWYMLKTLESELI